jgi:hypothetical protein
MKMGCDDMRILVTNFNDAPFGLQIEPWAQYETIEPNSRAEIIFDDHDCELEVSLTEEGGPFIGIMADITFSIDGRVIFNSRKT